MATVDNSINLYSYLSIILYLGSLLVLSNCAFEMDQTYSIDIDQTCTCYQNSLSDNDQGIDENLHQCMEGYEEFIRRAVNRKNIGTSQLDSLSRSYLYILVGELTKTCESYRQDYRRLVADQFFAPDSLAVELLYKAELGGVDTTDVHILKLNFAIGKKQYAYDLLKNTYLSQHPKQYYKWWVKGAMEYQLGMIDEAVASLENAISFAPNQAQHNMITYYQNAVSSIDTTKIQSFELTVPF